jgi:hypothetical protein
VSVWVEWICAFDVKRVLELIFCSLLSDEHFFRAGQLRLRGAGHGGGNEAGNGSLLELIVSVSGIYFCYGYYGVLQVEIDIVHVQAVLRKKENHLYSYSLQFVPIMEPA